MTDRERFLDDAIRVLRREVPEELEWLFADGVPALRWRDGTAVDERVPRGWLVVAAERDEPEPDEEMRRRAALFDPGDAAAFAVWLLRAWIEHDVAVPELDDARREELRAIAERAAELARRFGRGGSDPEERYRALLAQETNRPAPSALPHRGLLAIVAATADDRVVPIVERYREDHGDDRPEQRRVLLSMVRAGSESPAS